MKKLAKKFYVASRSITGDAHDPWCKRSIADAVKHARELLDDTDYADELFVVQIVRVVRRQKSPVIVEGVL